MRKRWISKLCLGALISGALVLVGCQGSTQEQRAEQITSYVASELDMDETQTEQLRGTATRLLEEGASFQDFRQDFLDEVLFQLKQDEVDQARLDQFVTDRKADISKAMDTVSTEFVALHKSLTPEQRATAIERLEKVKSHHSERRGRFGRWSHN